MIVIKTGRVALVAPSSGLVHCFLKAKIWKSSRATSKLKGVSPNLHLFKKSFCSGSLYLVIFFLTAKTKFCREVYNAFVSSIYLLSLSNSLSKRLGESQASFNSRNLLLSLVHT